MQCSKYFLISLLSLALRASAVSLRSGTPVSVSITGTDFVAQPHEAPRSNCGGGFDQLTDGSKTFYQDAVNSIWQHKWIGLDRDTFQIELQCMYAQMINICSTVQEETVENGRTRQERQTVCNGLAKHDSENDRSNKLESWALFKSDSEKQAWNQIPDEFAARKVVLDLNYHESQCLFAYVLDHKCNTETFADTAMSPEEKLRIASEQQR
uniref:Uncharacterized protein n=1 Tax=Noctiluca scintillans TaxID=2966 RepID=A0A7S0ZRS9_NOCSC|mmetsp:Transcript_16136/g.43868  ORF Transcript_16136/g.43868 Transcript_16136/m.43868 type:complete len:210 (+) Transcript_16136:73-702(+)